MPQARSRLENRPLSRRMHRGKCRPPVRLASGAPVFANGAATAAMAFAIEYIGRRGKGLGQARGGDEQGPAVSHEELREIFAIDEGLKADVEGAWNVSNPYGDGASKIENGFWVLRDDASSEISTIPFEGPATRDNINPGPVPRVKGKTVIAHFHTHPNTRSENYVSTHSPDDNFFAWQVRLPGVIRNHNGPDRLHFYGPERLDLFGGWPE